MAEIDDVARHAESRDKGARTALDQQLHVRGEGVGECGEQVDTERL